MSADFVQEAMVSPFSWGQMDCCQFAGLALESKGADNPMRLLEYSSEAEAEQIISGYGSLFKAVVNFLGEPVGVKGGSDGDVLMGELFNGEQILGVQLNNRMIVKTKKSVTDWPISRAIYRWEACHKR